MKKPAALAISLLLLLSACAPLGPKAPTDESGSSDASAPQAEAVMACKLVSIGDNYLVLAGEASGEVYVLAPPEDLYDMDFSPVAADALKAGQTVEVGYSGLVMETFPAQFYEPQYLRIAGEGEDLVGLYSAVIDDLWAASPALNEDAKIMAFDLSGVTNLSDTEKRALIWLMSNKYQADCIQSTFETLYDEGYIDKEQMCFTNGLLFKITMSEEGSKSFGFSAEKWRSGLGAYYFDQCTAKKSNGQWDYSIGGEAIS